MTRFLHVTDLHISMRPGEDATRARLDRLIATATSPLALRGGGGG